MAVKHTSLMISKNFSTEMPHWTINSKDIFDGNALTLNLFLEEVLEFFVDLSVPKNKFQIFSYLLKFVLLSDSIALLGEEMSMRLSELVEDGLSRLLSVAEVELLDLVHNLINLIVLRHFSPFC